jgi:magnesium transporter
MTVLVFKDGVTRKADAVDPAWLRDDAPRIVWVDIEEPGEADSALLSETFHFTSSLCEDALAEAHHPRSNVRSRAVPHPARHRRAARRKGLRDPRHRLLPGPQLPGHRASLHVAVDCEEYAVVLRHGTRARRGPCSLLHRIIDRMVDHYGPEVDGLEDRLERSSTRSFQQPGESPARRSWTQVGHRIVAPCHLPQRDVVSRLARREFIQISDAMSYRFRDVHDHLVRLADEAVFLQDRVTGLLDAHISTQSHRLNQVMKV